MVDASMPINSDWILVILTIGWILFGLISLDFVFIAVPTVIWIIMLVLGELN